MPSELELPHKLIVPLKIEEEIVEDLVPFYEKKSFWVIAGVVLLSIGFTWWLHKK